MILVDTSAWISFFKGQGILADQVEEFLLGNQAAFCGPVKTELLRGFKNEREKKKIFSLMDGCLWLDQPENLWENAGELGYLTRRKGKTLKTFDLLIATYALKHQIPVLTSDSDFKFIQAAGIPLLLV